MLKSLRDKKDVFHLQEHAVWRREDGIYEYMSWDTRREKLTWISGIALVVEDILCLTVPQSEGEEESVPSRLDLEFELSKLPKWDKTKYYCVLVIGGRQAALVQRCENGQPLKAGEEDFNKVKEMLAKHDVAFA
jgi:hypothetical protein